MVEDAQLIKDILAGKPVSIDDVRLATIQEIRESLLLKNSDHLQVVIEKAREKGPGQRMWLPLFLEKTEHAPPGFRWCAAATDDILKLAEEKK